MDGLHFNLFKCSFRPIWQLIETYLILLSYSEVMIGTIELLVLTGICRATKISKSAHVPKPYFMKKFQADKHQKKAADKALLFLIARGYVRQHPTKGEMTYELTSAGLDLCREIFNKK
jgi:hypothetical protein